MVKTRAKQDKDNWNKGLSRFQNDLKLEATERKSELEMTRTAFMSKRHNGKVENDTLNERLTQVERDLKLESAERKQTLELSTTFLMVELKENTDEKPISKDSLQKQVSKTREHLEFLEVQMQALFDIFKDYISTHSLVNAEKSKAKATMLQNMALLY